MALGGNAWDKAGKVWHIALRDRLRPTARFKDAADATISVARDEYGVGSTEETAVKTAWAQVGVL
jgi:Zn-dependent metalloprotease